MNTKSNNNYTNYNQQLIISMYEYLSAPGDMLTINSIELSGNYLKINYSSSGCSGDTWVVNLIDSGNIMESNPPQRNLRLSLKNEELCLAYITKEITFDVSKLQVEGNQVVLNITNYDDQISYTY